MHIDPTEGFLQDLADGRFDLDELICDDDIVMGAIVEYAIDSYLGNYEGKASTKAVQLDKITRGLNRMVSRLEEDATNVAH